MPIAERVAQHAPELRAEGTRSLAAGLCAFFEHEPVNFFGHSLSRVDIRAMSAKRSHSLVELRVRQTRQEGVGAQCRLPDEAWPVRGYDLRDNLNRKRHVRPISYDSHSGVSTTAGVAAGIG